MVPFLVSICNSSLRPTHFNKYMVEFFKISSNLFNICLDAFSFFLFFFFQLLPKNKTFYRKNKYFLFLNLNISLKNLNLFYVFTNHF